LHGEVLENLAGYGACEIQRVKDLKLSKHPNFDNSHAELDLHRLVEIFRVDRLFSAVSRIIIPNAHGAARRSLPVGDVRIHLAGLFGFHCRKLGLDITYGRSESFQCTLKARRRHYCSCEHIAC
jgi:hypothetical protein